MFHPQRLRSLNHEKTELYRMCISPRKPESTEKMKWRGWYRSQNKRDFRRRCQAAPPSDRTECRSHAGVRIQGQIVVRLRGVVRSRCMKSSQQKANRSIQGPLLPTAATYKRALSLHGKSQRVNNGLFFSEEQSSQGCFLQYAGL